MITGAAAVVTVDPTIVEHAFGPIAPGDRPPLHTIQNGYDEEDFRHAAPADLPRFSIVHTGLLRRSPEPLWKALAQALYERPALAGRVHLWQVGFVAPEARAGLAAPPPGVTVHEVPPVPQREAISYMLGADLLLVEEFGKIMPSKTLQYLRAGRPVLAFQEDGGVIRDVLQPVPDAVLVGRAEASRAASLIAELASRPRCPPHEPVPAVAGYERREIARRFAAVLDEACRGIGAGAGPGTRVRSRPS
jgi:glycosyltransferase involved in cell wall biosynthesis